MEGSIKITMTKLTKILLGLLALLLLTSCYDQKELEQQSFVIAIGIDQTEEEGLYQFTFQIANPEVGSTLSSGGSQEPPRETVSMTGTDLLTATNTANAFVSKEIILDQSKVIIISEQLARSEDFLRIIQSASRSPQIRRGVQLIVSKENASVFLNNTKPTMEQQPHKYYQYMLSRAKQTGIIPDANLHRFFQITEGDADLFLAIYATTERSEEKLTKSEDHYIAGEIPQEGGNPTQFMGSAVFKEGQMIDIINGQETRLCNILDKSMQMDDLLATYPDPLNPKYNIAADYAQKSNPTIALQYDRKSNQATINVTVPFELEILAVPSLIDYSKNDKNQKILRDSIEKVNEEKTLALIKKSQTEYGSDPFYWSIYIRKYFLDVPDFEKADWNKKIYPNATVKVNYEMKRLRFGKMLNDSKLDEVRD